MTKTSTTSAKLWTPNFIRIFLANFTTCAIGNMFNSPYALHLVSLGGKEMHVGVAAFIYAVCSVMMRPVAAWFLDNRSRKKIYFFCLLATGGVMWGYLFTPLIMMIVVRGFQGLFLRCGNGVHHQRLRHHQSRKIQRGRGLPGIFQRHGHHADALRRSVDLQ